MTARASACRRQTAPCRCEAQHEDILEHRIRSGDWDCNGGALRARRLPDRSDVAGRDERCRASEADCRTRPPGRHANRGRRGYRECGALVRDVETQFGAIDALHFNAASMRAATIETQAADTFVPDLTVNIGAALVAIQNASRGMLARRAGTILLTGAIRTRSQSGLSLAQHRQGRRPALTHALFVPFRDQGVAYRVGHSGDDGGSGVAAGGGSCRGILGSAQLSAGTLVAGSHLFRLRKATILTHVVGGRPPSIRSRWIPAAQAV